MATPPAKLNAEERKTLEAAASNAPFGKGIEPPPGFKMVVPETPVMLVGEDQDGPSQEDLTPSINIAPKKPKVLLVAPEFEASTPPPRNPSPDPLPPDPDPPYKSPANGPLSEAEEEEFLAEIMERRRKRKLEQEQAAKEAEKRSELPDGFVNGPTGEPLRFENASIKASSDAPFVEGQKIMDDAVVQKIVEAVDEIHESRSPAGLPSYRCEFEGRDIFVGLPWYKTSNPVTSFALLALALDFGRDKIRFDLSMGDAMIHHSRNELAKRFLETDARWLFMMDDDIIPSIGRPGWFRTWVAAARKTQDTPLQRHVLHRLVGAGKTLIGGAYFGRQEGAGLMCSDYKLGPRARAYEDAVVPVDWVATGCLLIHRKVLLDIMEKFPELKSQKPGTPFDFFRPKNHETGEDVSFCQRAKEAGHQSHIDLGLPVYHVGYRCYP